MMHGLNTYDFGARNYNPLLPMWDKVDPKAGDYPWLSPYVYCLNKPLLFIDPNGREGIKYEDELGNKYVEENVVVLLKKHIEIPYGADDKTIKKIERKNTRIDRWNNNRIGFVKNGLENVYGNVVNSNGEKINFKFNIVGLYVENTNVEKLKEIKEEVINYGLPAVTENRINGALGYNMAIPAVISTASAGSHLGLAVNNAIVRLNSNTDYVLGHEIGHTLGLSDSYGGSNGFGYGLMGSPPTAISPLEVDEIWNNAYKRR